VPIAVAMSRVIYWSVSKNDDAVVIVLTIADKPE